MRLHIFVDGSWLFRACSGGSVLAGKTETTDRPFSLDFNKLNATLLNHVQSHDPNCDSLGEMYFAISIFEFPPDFDNWPQIYQGITPETITRTRMNSQARTMFTEAAINSGYSRDVVYPVRVKEWTIRNLMNGTYQEKQVDASVVALLVRSAITSPRDYHAFITGDSDILPAIRVAYPEYTNNVIVVSSHPDELRAEHRQASFSLNNFNFDVPPFFLQQHAAEIMAGDWIYTCTECGKVFCRPRPVPQRKQPFCRNCYIMRQ